MHVCAQRKSRDGEARLLHRETIGECGCWNADSAPNPALYILTQVVEGSE